MQTIYVTVKQVPRNGFALQIGNKVIATIRKDYFNKGRYAASFGVYASGNNLRYPEAVEFITGQIERVFAGFGLNVEFN